MNQAPRRPPYLFYSPKCPHSQQLIQLIQRNQSLSNEIQPVNVHTASSLPPNLKEVPAILDNGYLHVGPDTFKWVHFQSQAKGQEKSGQNQNQDQGQGQGRMQGQGGIPNQPGQGQNQGGMQGQGIPDDNIMPSEMGMGGIDFTPLAGQESINIDPTIPRFSYLPGESNQSDGTNGIDYATANNPDLATKNKSAGVDKQLERLQQMRGADTSASYNQGGPGFSGPMGTPSGGVSGGYELESGQQGGYSTQYQQQHGNQQGNQQFNDNSLPKRF